jgi:NifU-like protein involved in Fe-S cluster formation
MAETYSEIALDHFRNPRNAGTIHDADGIGSVENPASGAVVSLQLKIVDERIVRAVFQARGCTATIAAASVLTEMVAGLSVSAAEVVNRADVEAGLGGLPPTRKHAAALACDAVRAAVADFRARVRA